jgi:hypothetical protein
MDIWLDEFKAKVENDQSNIITINRLKNNPTTTRKGKVVIQIQEKEELQKPTSPIHSLSFSNTARKLINSNTSEAEYFTDIFNGKESPHDFYTRTRSRYVAKKESELDYLYKYEITYQTSGIYDNEKKRLNNLRNQNDINNNELKKKLEKHHNSSYIEI